MLVRMTENFACPEMYPLQSGQVYDLPKELADKLLGHQPPLCTKASGEAAIKRAQDLVPVDKDSMATIVPNPPAEKGK
jgi:hypothetical protein